MTKILLESWSLLKFMVILSNKRKNIRFVNKIIFNVEKIVTNTHIVG